jgi:Pyruvate/2-oxoacid:ferredoxin oxidoreductase delta subunit
MKDSTRALFRLNGWRFDRAIHGYVYFTWIDYYIKALMAIARRYIRVLPRGRFIFDYFFNRYHCKVLTEGQAVKLLRLERDVEVAPELSSRVIPYPHANRIVLKNPRSIVVMDCACRIERGIKDPEELGVCIAVGEPVASFWLEHGEERLHARRITADEAVEIMRRARKKGSIPTAWFKDAAGDGFFAICNCSPGACDALEAARIAARLQVENPPGIALASGYCAHADSSLCIGCGTCMESCPFKAIVPDDEGKAVVLFDLCMGCGLCADGCEQEAFSLVRDGRKGIPLDIAELA